MKLLPKDNPEFQELDREITRTIPNFKEIEKCLAKVPPAVVAIAVQDDVGFTYLLDYYLKHVDPTIVKNILQNPLFTHEALVELFYCQVTAYHKAILQKKPLPELISSYWTYLSKAELAVIFKSLLQKTSNLIISKQLLQNIDLVYLKMMTTTGSISSNKILDAFKSLGPEIKKLAAHDMNVYDFAFNLAVEQSDFDYIIFLEEYTAMFVQLRAASFFVEEIENQIKKTNHIPTYVEIHEICAGIPRDTLKVALQIFQERGWISENENKSIDEFYSKRK